MFHVEISAGMRRARVFNLDRADLLAQVVEPWLEERTIEMGDREWQPRESGLTILEGPRMENADLAFGQGWANAERGCANVTRNVLEAVPPPARPDAYAVETAAPEEFAAGLVAEHGARAIEWGEARERIDGRDPEVTAVILVLRRPGREGPRS